MMKNNDLRYGFDVNPNRRKSFSNGSRTGKMGTAILLLALILGFSAGSVTAQDSLGRRVRNFFGGHKESPVTQTDLSPRPQSLSSERSLKPSPPGEKIRPVSGWEFSKRSETVSPPEAVDAPFMSEAAGREFYAVASSHSERPTTGRSPTKVAFASTDAVTANEMRPESGTPDNLTTDAASYPESTDAAAQADRAFLADSTDAESAENESAQVPAPTPLKADDRAETLETAWNVALDASRTLSAKDFDRSKADAEIRAARGVGLPKVSNASGVHTVSKELAIQTDVPLSQLSPMLPDIQLDTPIADKDFTTSVTALTVPIYMGGRVRGMIEAAQAASNAVSFGKQISRQDLKYEVAQTYFLVLRVRRLREVAVEAERTIASHETDAKRLFENGIVTKNVILAAQVARANAQQDVIRANNAVSLSEAAYNRLLWRSLNTPVRIADVEIPELSGDLETLTAEAITRRPELAALAYKSQALSAEAKVHRADRLPQVAAVGSHNYIENSHLNENSTFSGSLGVVWMPFDGGVSRSRQEASSFEAMSVSREHEDARSKIELQVYQCWLDEQETRSRVDVAHKAVEQADENLRVVTRGFKEGLANHTEVLDAQTLRTQAWSNLANARYDAVLATYHLRRAVGEL